MFSRKKAINFYWKFRSDSVFLGYHSSYSFTHWDLNLKIEHFKIFEILIILNSIFAQKCSEKQKIPYLVNFGVLEAHIFTQKANSQINLGLHLSQGIEKKSAKRLLTISSLLIK